MVLGRFSDSMRWFALCACVWGGGADTHRHCRDVGGQAGDGGPHDCPGGEGGPPLETHHAGNASQHEHHHAVVEQNGKEVDLYPADVQTQGTRQGVLLLLLWLLLWLLLLLWEGILAVGHELHFGC